MGVNAQTTVPTFTASQVLTADQMNQSARTGVPVFSSTVTRDAGFGGTGEKTLAEGQLCYVEGTGLQTYNGTAWVTWGAAPSSGLTLISTTTIGSAVSSVTVSSAFSSTYDNYRIILNGGVGSTTLSLLLTFGATATNYEWSYLIVSNGSVSGVGNTAATSITAGIGNTDYLSMVCDVSNPNLAKNTLVTGSIGYERNNNNGRPALTGILKDTTAYTAFTLTTSTGTITGGTIRVYGYQNS